MSDLPCRLLLIEDDPRQATTIEQKCCPDPLQATIDVIANAADAEIAVEDGEYDLIICDLALPADERRLEPDTAHGLKLFKLIRDRSQGTPVIILSANADLQMMQDFFQANRAADLYGTRTEQPLVQFFEKEQLPDCVAAVQAHVARTVQLDRLELQLPSGVELSLSDQRAVRIFGRRCGASIAVLESLDGGLSDSRTFRVAFRDQDGENTGTVVIKLGGLASVLREASRYEDVVARLPVGLGAHILFVVGAGAGKGGALIYQLADEYDSSLFQMLRDRNQAAVTAVGRLRERLHEWVRDAPTIVKPLTEIRRGLISDLKVMQAGGSAAPERGIEVSVQNSLVHGDLHGANVLVTQQGEPTLIDYGEVRRANSALDPVTLELSAVFHPAMAGKLGGWPTEQQCALWSDLDAYCSGCPIEAFVRACREWAHDVAAGEVEVLASAYAYATRQTKYGESTRPLAEALAAAALVQMSPP